MEAISYKLDVFEGPMDLLLHLISKHKIDINDIPILLLVEQYLDYVRQMQEEDMEIASEFLEMAARLVYIKTVSLLPVHEEEADALKNELQGELSEYKDCKLMAQKLSEKAEGFDFISRKPEKFAPDMTYTRLHEPFELLKAYIAAVGRGKRNLPPPIEAFSGIVAHKIVPIKERVGFIMDKLFRGKKQRFRTFFEKAESRSEMVATFLALLSLTKDKKIVLTEVEGDLEVEMVDSNINFDVEEHYADENE
ncbi:MAG: segregation/condensation protein A [Acutalibacteraceae bacterium]|nr:segregation/condensation protein A [Acutalibacteraceae bacterium]